MAKRLRSGYTTGACAAAAAKAAALFLKESVAPDEVEIAFPEGFRRRFTVHRCKFCKEGVWSSVIKDAGDDPDVTNGAEIGAFVRFRPAEAPIPVNSIRLDKVVLTAGAGVGRVTKPGLAAGVGEPAINPVPRTMIAQAIAEVFTDRELQVAITVKDGEELAKKTLNKRLGIIGGLSILGTTGIVRPVSTDAWKATIKASMAVARKAGLPEVVLSTGRTSERGAQSLLSLPDEAYAMMGDYLAFSLTEAANYGFSKIHLAGMWAKITKAALKVPQTHVRNGALDVADAACLLEKLGAEGKLLEKLKQANTAREMYDHLQTENRRDIIRAVCLKAKEYGRETAGCETEVYLVSHKGEVVDHV